MKNKLIIYGGIVPITIAFVSEEDARKARDFLKDSIASESTVVEINDGVQEITVVVGKVTAMVLSNKSLF